MAKTAEKATFNEHQVTVPTSMEATRFRDKLYTSRTMVLPGGRVMSVAQAQVTVAEDDEAAVNFFDQRSDFERITG